MKSSVLRDSDVEGTAGDILVPPLHDEDVAALLFDCVRHVVHPVAHVFDVYFFAWRLWPVDAHHQHVGACRDTNIQGNVLVHGLRLFRLPNQFP